MPQTPLNASQIPRDWSGWPQIWKTRTELCRQKAGPKAFEEFLDSMIKPPRKFGQNQARRIVAMLRGAPGGAPYPHAFPFSDIFTVIQYVHKDGSKYDKPTLNILGNWAREGGGRVYYSTIHLNGTFSAPSVAKHNTALMVMSASLGLVRAGADRLETITPESCEDLEPGMRAQMREQADAELARIRRVYELLEVGE